MKCANVIIRGRMHRFTELVRLSRANIADEMREEQYPR
jgi:hypothetical protein